MVSHLKLVLLLFILYFSLNSSDGFSQITQNNWMMGGAGTYTNQKTDDFRTTYLLVSPCIGYFVVDKLLVGITPEFVRYTSSSGISKLVTNEFNFGPFIRYYALKKENQFNIVTEAGYLFSSIKAKTNPGSSTRTNIYYAGVGPKVFLNTSVGIECLFGFRHYKAIRGSNQQQFLINLGFQIYLERQ